MADDTKQEDLRAGLEFVIQRARTEAAAGAPGLMVARYVEAEARHALDGHDPTIPGVDCMDCWERVDAEHNARAAGTCTETTRHAPHGSPGDWWCVGVPKWMRH